MTPAAKCSEALAVLGQGNRLIGRKARDEAQELKRQPAQEGSATVLALACNPL
jgi:hypothetical protein